MSFWQDTGRSAKGCTRVETDVVWDQLKPTSQPSTVRLRLVTEEEKRRDDLCSPARVCCRAGCNGPIIPVCFGQSFDLQGWVEKEPHWGSWRTGFWKTAADPIPVPLSSTLWGFTAPLGRLLDKPFPGSLRLWRLLPQKTTLPRGAEGKVLRVCAFPSHYQHPVLHTRPRSRKGVTSAQFSFPVRVTLSRASLARRRRARASSHVCSVNKGNGYRVPYVLPGLSRFFPSP